MEATAAAATSAAGTTAAVPVEGAVDASAPAKSPAMSLKERLRAKAQAEKSKHVFRKPDEAPTKDATPADETAEKATEAEAKPDGEGEEPKTETSEGETEEKKPEAKGLEAKLARTQLDLKRAQAEAVRAKAEVEKERRRAQSAESRIEAAEKDPFKALELAKIDFKDFVIGVKEGKFGKSAQQQAVLPPELQEKLARLEKLAEETEREKLTTQQKQIRDQEIQTVTGYLKERAEELPMLSSAGWAPEQIYAEFYRLTEQTGQQPELSELVKSMEQSWQKQVTAVLSQESVLKTVLKDSKIRDLVAKHLSLAEQKKAGPASAQNKGKPTTADGPRVVPQSVATEVPARVPAPELSEEDQRKQALSAVREWKRKLKG